MTIDWAALRTAHGNAAHVPDALARLRSDVDDTRKAAYWQLDNHVVLQGNLFEAAPFVADELIRMLDGELSDATKSLVYRLLFEIRNGYASDTTTVIRDGRSVLLREACHQVVGDALSLYRSDLTTADVGVRREVIDLLASMEDRRDEVAALLTEAQADSQQIPHNTDIMADLNRGLRDLYEDD